MFSVRESYSERIFKVINIILLGVFAFIALFPFVNVIAISLSSSRAINSGEIFLFPVEMNFEAFHNLIKDGQMFAAMKNSANLTFIGVLLNMAATVIAAYPLSKKGLKGRKFLLVAITFTMIFNAGIIPNFILIKDLKLVNTYWSLWLPSLISTYNMFVMKSFFEGIPESLEESAALDGANDILILIRIVLPLSLPVIATLTLFYAVSWWNQYFNAMIYITSSQKQTLMVKLMQMIDASRVDMLSASSTSGSDGGMSQSIVTTEGLRAAAIVIATFPILLIYPFLQKYFVKGVMIGSVKE